MGISRDSRHKRRPTGGRRISIKKKRKYELGRPAALTKLGKKRIHLVRGRGGNLKFRALRLEMGNFSWGSQVVTRKTRILDVVYNASNNELVRTKTLVKNAIIEVDATPFRQWYEDRTGLALAKKADSVTPADPNKQMSERVKAKKAKAAKEIVMDQLLRDRFASGRLLACVSSRPGQSGRCDGYILEGPELDFYARKLRR